MKESSSNNDNIDDENKINNDNDKLTKPALQKTNTILKSKLS